ncbi:MAG TPA: GAF domain-containing protein [Anaeromyxobacter sp.]|nr:GAF domain-containing protein [Anaeromyxobacter sp.]
MSDPRKPAVEPAPERGRDLREVNERLKELVASLRSEKERLAEPRPPIVPAPAAALADTVDLEKKRLSAELASAREETAQAAAERDELREKLAALEAEHQRITDDYVAVQEKSTDLAQLYVALERLHGGLSRADTLAAIQEIVINLVGSEELAVFERRAGALTLVHAFGVAPRVLDALPLDDGAIARAVEGGRPWFAGRDERSAPGEEDLTAAIPLRAGDAVAGVLAIFRLLGHKPVLADADHAVFDLLGTHAALALRLRDPRGSAAAG